MDSKLSYGRRMKQRNKIVSGFLVQHIQSCMYTNEFAPSLGSSGLDLGFLPYNARILAMSEQGIMVFRTPDPKDYKKDLYHVCKPATKQVRVLPSPQGYYTLHDKFALVVMSTQPLHYKIIRLIDRPDVRRSGESYTKYRCHVFDSMTWRWRSLEHVKLEDGVFLSNSLPVTNNGSVYMLLEDNSILNFDAHSERWKVILPPIESTETSRPSVRLVRYGGMLGLACKPLKIYQYYESTETSRPSVRLVRYRGKLGLACKPVISNGCWEIWVLNEVFWKMNTYVYKDKEGEIGSLSAFCEFHYNDSDTCAMLDDSETSAMLDYDTLKFYNDDMTKKVVLKDIPYQSFFFRSDFKFIQFDV